jgi:hypothetical protein
VVSPRRNNRRAEATGLDEAKLRRGTAWTRSTRDGEWMVRPIPTDAATKTYRCPGCQQEIRPATAHLVVWPAEGWGEPDDRRHWHTPCWRGRR